MLCVILSAILISTQTLQRGPSAHDTCEVRFDTEFGIVPMAIGHLLLIQSQQLAVEHVTIKLIYLQTES